MRNSDPPQFFTLRYVLSRKYNGILSSLRKLFLCKKAQNSQIRNFLQKSDLRNIRKTCWNELKFCNIVCIYQTFHLETILVMSWISEPHFQIRNFQYIKNPQYFKISDLDKSRKWLGRKFLISYEKYGNERHSTEV